jgi:hypothetical protein
MLAVTPALDSARAQANQITGAIIHVMIVNSQYSGRSSSPTY